MAKPLHPMLQQAIVIGARLGAKTLAGAANSFLREVGLGAREVEKTTVKARRDIKKKLVQLDEEAGLTSDNEDEDEDEEESESWSKSSKRARAPRTK